MGGGGVRSYLLMRLIRVFPVYWIVFSLNIIPYIIKQSDYDWVFLIRSFFLIPQNSSPLVIVAWTLTYEVYFYLIFALFFLNRRFAQLFFIVYMLFVLIYNVLNLGSIIGQYSSLNFALSPFQLLFGLGMLLAYLNNKYKRFISDIAKSVLAVGFLLFLSATLFELVLTNCDQTFGRPETSFIWRVFYGLPSSLIILGLVNLPTFEFKFSAFIGAASYSIYLIHNDFMTLTFKLIDRMGSVKVLMGHNFLLLIMFLVPLVCSMFFYFFVDRRIQVSLRKLLT